MPNGYGCLNGGHGRGTSLQARRGSHAGGHGHKVGIARDEAVLFDVQAGDLLGLRYSQADGLFNEGEDDDHGDRHPGHDRDDAQGLHAQEAPTAAIEQAVIHIQKAGGGNYDILVPSDYMIERLIQNDLLAELNYDNIPNASLIMDQFKGMAFDPNDSYSVPYMWGTVGILYNTSLLPEGTVIDSWDALWNPGQLLRQSGQGCLVIQRGRRALPGIASLLCGYPQPVHLQRPKQGGVQAQRGILGRSHLGRGQVAAEEPRKTTVRAGTRKSDSVDSPWPGRTSNRLPTTP